MLTHAVVVLCRLVYSSFFTKYIFLKIKVYSRKYFRNCLWLTTFLYVVKCCPIWRRLFLILCEITTLKPENTSERTTDQRCRDLIFVQVINVNNRSKNRIDYNFYYSDKRYHLGCPRSEKSQILKRIIYLFFPLWVLENGKLRQNSGPFFQDWATVRDRTA